MWLAFPNNKNPKLWVSNKSSLKTAFSLYNPYSKKAKTLKKIIMFMPKKVGQLFLKLPTSNKQQDTFGFYKKHIDKILNIDSIINISPGTKSKHQKSTIQIIENGIIKYYLKASDKPATIKLSENEYKILNILANNKGPISTPAAICGEKLSSHYFLIQTAPAGNYSQSDTSFNAPQTNALLYLYGLGTSELNLTHYISDIARNIFETQPLVKKKLLNTLEKLDQYHKNKKIRLALSHGDFTPWNILINKNKELFIFDWEHGNETSPLLFDFFHFHYMIIKLLTHNKPQDINTYLNNLYHKKDLQLFFNYMNINESDFKLYKMLYIIQIVLREIEENDQPSSISMEILAIA